MQARQLLAEFCGVTTGMGTSCAGAALGLGGNALSASINHLRSMFAFKPCGQEGTDGDRHCKKTHNARAISRGA